MINELNLRFSCLNSANLMTCISKQTKVLEAAVRELRGELSTRCEQYRNKYFFSENQRWSFWTDKVATGMKNFLKIEHKALQSF